MNVENISHPALRAPLPKGEFSKKPINAVHSVNTANSVNSDLDN